MLERDIQRSILDYLKVRGYLCKRNQSGMTLGEYKGKRWAIRMGEAGWPDIIGIGRERSKRGSHGLFFGIEVKQPGKKPTPAQNAILDAIIDSGGIAFVATSLDDVIARGF